MQDRVLIIGAGPGGLSCATYLQRLGISSVVIYQTFGGKQNYYKNIYGLYPEKQLKTEDFLKAQKASLDTASLENDSGADITFVCSSVDSISKDEGGRFKVSCKQGNSYSSGVVVLATGTRVFVPDTLKSALGDPLTFKNYPFPDLKLSDQVLILGAGYTAAEMADVIKDKVASILVLDLSRENHSFLGNSRLKLFRNSENIEVVFDDKYILSKSHVTYHREDSTIDYAFDKAILCTGEKANVDFLPEHLLNSESGRVEVISNPASFEVNMSPKWKGLFAIGDVKNDQLTSYIDFAIADGMRTAQSIFRYSKENNEGPEC